MFIINSASSLSFFHLLSLITSLLIVPVYALENHLATNILFAAKQKNTTEKISPTSLPEEEKKPKKGINYRRLALLSISGATVDYAAFKYFDRAWYEGRKQNHIRWLYDWYGDAYLDMDKGGHFMSSLYLAQILQDAYRWTGFSPKSAALLGTGTSWAALLQVEMRDAYFADWGFSVPDFFYNTLGASIPLIHTLIPSTQVLNFKISYHPSSLYLNRKERALQGQPHTEFIVDDYEGITFWMTFAPNDILWEQAEEIWPDYLGLAVGYGATGLHGSHAKSKGRFKYYKDRPDAQPEFFLAFDYDIRHLLGEGPIWHFLKTQLNTLHLPAPAIRLYPEWRFYLLYM